MKNKSIRLTDTTFRDAQQNLWATRMRTKDMLPIAVHVDNVGYHSLEVWGGSTFDVGMRYLNECPWERLRALKNTIKRTPLQMLLRGQTLVGYQHYPDDVVRAFIRKAVENGIDIIRVYDALNDIRNLETSVKAAKEHGAHVQAAIVYSISPVHTIEYYVDFANKLAGLGSHSICIKDMAGLLTPTKAYELVKHLRKQVGLPVQLHSHFIGGMALATYVKAAEAGVDILDTAALPLAFGASQPPVETVVKVLRDTPWDTGLDIHALFDIAHYFEDLRKELKQERATTRISDMRVFDHQVPGGMISNLVTQLEEQKALHRIDEVINEIPRVRAEFGYPPLVTPISQIVGTQAVINILVGERYKLVPGEVKSFIKGLYGRPPAQMDPGVVKLILGDTEPIDCAPSDLLEPRMETARGEMAHLSLNEEDLLSYIMFPQVAKRFFENRDKALPDRTNTREAITEQLSIKKIPANNHGSMEIPTATAAPVNKTDKILAKEVPNMKLNEIKEIIKLIDETDIAEVNLECEGVKVSIRKSGALNLSPSEQQAPMVKHTPVMEKQVKPLPGREETAPAVRREETSDDLSGLTQIMAPMVGTFYRAPSPEHPPFVQIGDNISKGQILCIIEAMKLMNEIEAEHSGQLVKVLVEDGESVEYGQPLFLIKEK